MKRIFVFFLSAVLMLSLAACGGETAPTEAPVPSDGTIQPTSAPATEMAAEMPTEAPAAEYDLSETVLADDENCAFTITGINYNEHLGMELQVLCENKSDRNMMFSLDNVSVCGVMYDPFWAEEVSAGKKVNSTVSFDTFQLEEMGIPSVDEVSFRLSVIDNDEWMNEPFVDKMFTVYPTGLSAETVVYPEYQHKNGETVIVDNDDLTFIIEKVDDTASGYYTLNCYVANKTDKNLMVSWDGVSVNGFMVDPFWAAAVGAGKQLYSDISFFSSDLEAQGIETVTDIAFTLYAYDYDSVDGTYLAEETFTYQPE